MFEAIVDLLFPPACGACDAPGSGLCNQCTPPPESRERFALDGLAVYASGRYEGALRAAVLCMKRGRKDVAEALASDLAGRWGGNVPAGSTLVWAPTTARRRADRGFDQAEVIARVLARRLGLAAARGLHRRSGPAQRGRSRVQRLDSRDRFIVDEAVLRGAETVVLVDDVVTTGSTLRDARRALQSVGVVTCLALVIARTI